MLLNHNSPASIQKFLTSRGIAPRKRWGQNFLINRGAREKIMDLLNITPGSKIWEIGPGLGAMSELILRHTRDFVGFEIDSAFCRWLDESYSSQGMTLIPGDVMHTWQDQWRCGKPDRIVGNLPFNAASAIIAVFIEAGCQAQRMVLTVQDEMGRRITSPPNCKTYSSFSILCQAHCRVIDGGQLSPGSFYPSPRVNSRIIILEPARLHGTIHCTATLHKLVRTLFLSRRKTLNNNLKFAEKRPGFPPIDTVRTVIREVGIALDRRPETLSPDNWVDIANKVASCSSAFPQKP